MWRMLVELSTCTPLQYEQVQVTQHINSAIRKSQSPSIPCVIVRSLEGLGTRIVVVSCAWRIRGQNQLHPSVTNWGYNTSLVCNRVCGLIWAACASKGHTAV